MTYNYCGDKGHNKKGCVGFINPGSLMDLLPSKNSAHQTTLRTTHNSWAGPKT